MSWKPAQSPSRVPDWVPDRLRGVVGWVLKCGMVCLALSLAVGLLYFYLALRYDLDQVALMPERSVIVDRDGVEFAALHGERRRLVTRQEIPDFMVEALLAREDVRFTEHYGVDVRGLARATVRNIKDLSFTQGASTLTMQLARNTYDMRAKSLHRKLLEVALTLRMEARYTKDEILTHYLNRIYFGAGCHGVEAAAQTYFGRSVGDLNAGECALLVGIVRGPHLFSPSRNLEGAEVQRDEVLERMVECDFLTFDEAEVVKGLAIRMVTDEQRTDDSSYLLEAIRGKLQVILDEYNIRSGGLRVHTTVDVGLQREYEARLEAPLAAFEEGDVGEVQAAVIVLNPFRGGILAVCGGRDFAASSFNRAYLAKRDLGPGFSPFLSALAVERNQLPIVGQAVQTGRQLGVEETMRLSQRLGFTGPFVATEDLYRGALAVSPVELVRAASMMVSGGKRVDPFLIDRITDGSGLVLYERQISSDQVIRKDAAGEAREVFEQSGEAFFAVTNSRRDGWAIRVGRERVAVVWLGHDQPQAMGTKESIENGLRAVLGLK